MTEFHFLKMEGLGNDFVLFDGRRFSQKEISDLTEKTALTHIANRHRGIGCDQIILLTQGTGKNVLPLVRFFNQDGSEAEACGNGSRCILLFLHLQGEKELCFQTGNGLVHGHINEDNVTVILPPPSFTPADIPMRSDLKKEDIFSETAEKNWQKSYACSVGNPHATLFFTKQYRLAAEREKFGPIFEKHPDFPEQVNVGFAHMHTPHLLDLFVWERGSGATLACGTGACAAAINGISLGLATSPVTVCMEGGNVRIEWKGGEKDPVHLSGPARSCYHGVIDSASFTSAQK